MASTKKKTEDDKVDTENVTFGSGSRGSKDPISLGRDIGSGLWGAGEDITDAVSGLFGLGGGGGQTALAKEVTAQSTANAQEIFNQALINEAMARGYTGPTSVGFAPVSAPDLLLGSDYAARADTRAVATDFRPEIMGYDAALAQAADASSRIQQANVERAQQQAPAMVQTVDTTIKAPTIGPAAQTGAVGVERVGLLTSADALRAEQIKAARAISGGPLASATQFRASQGQVVADQLAMAERARGAERAGARREAMIAAGQQGMSAGLAASALAAQEEQARRIAGASALSGIRGQDVTSATAGAQIAAEQANLQAQLNAAIAQGNTAAINAIKTRQAELALTARQTQVQAEITEQATKADLERANLAARQQTALANAQAQNVASGDWAAAYNAAAGQTAQNQTAVALANAAAQTQAAQDLANARNQAASTYAQMATGTSQANVALAQQQASENAARALAADTTNQAAVQAARTQTASNQQAAQAANAANQLSTQQLRQTGATSALGAGTAATGVQAGNAQTIVDANKQQSADAASKQNAMIGALATGAAAAIKYSDERVKRDIRPVGGVSGDGDWASNYQAAGADVSKLTKEDVDDWAASIDPVAFRYKPGVEDGGANEHLGLVAQDLEKHPLGQLMVGRGPKGTRTVDYGAATLMLSKAAFDKAVETELMLKQMAAQRGGR